jgi:hypothetical protein
MEVSSKGYAAFILNIDQLFTAGSEVAFEAPILGRC